MTLKLVIGNKNNSSWSLRSWLVLQQFGIPHQEVLIPLGHPNTQGDIDRYSPSGRVPVLVDGELTIWDSLSICEYLAEKFPHLGIWPKEARARAVARSVCCEMHSGFQELRRSLPMKIRQSLPTPELTPEIRRDIRRVFDLWTDCRERFGGQGLFLFGDFTAADAFYAPVVTRFRTYSVPLEGIPATYSETIWNLPSMRKWLAGAQAEPYTLDR